METSKYKIGLMTSVLLSNSFSVLFWRCLDVPEV